MGKTQLAVAYTKQHRTDYSASIWINATDETTLKQSFYRAAQRISRQYQSVLYIKNAVANKDLNETLEALVVYDNYDNVRFDRRNGIASSTRPGTAGSWSNPGNTLSGSAVSKAYDIRSYLPETDHGTVIITTRSATVKLGKRIPLGKLRDVNDSLAILTSTSNRNNLVEDPDATTLTRRLNGLPLALATARAYLDQVATSYKEYLEIYEKAYIELKDNTWVFHALGNLYSDQGRLKEAEAMYERALQGKEKALGPDHTSTLSTVNNLGIFYSDQGRLKEAEAITASYLY
ncbi:hypothetical protein BDP81DRAFT_463949 [Colletotrichum phormii]|uniref:Kinesin light chain n=1 Tax=Colletotrichum phormii TaxID=359342 RepID=A0AAI9ZLD7_9PEZI|nr:uncharacterized protein BDP81DRAFT_463949 [Colletotrichum phormii]KAK1625431.1 hypothetical protein BDP81DRAFT_463949 [Colletotrichum phormii]